jgi:hypothetical protein
VTETLSKHDLVAFLQEHLRPDDFNRICYLSRNKTNCRLLLRMTQKINDVEHIIVTFKDNNMMLYFIPDALAQKPFHSLTDADMIPDSFVFIED